MESVPSALIHLGPDGVADATAFGCGGVSFTWGDRICAIFDNPDQQMDVMLPFIAQGLRAAQRCVWIAAPTAAERFRLALAGIGADLPMLEASGQLVIISEVGFYLQDGLFDPERTLELGRVLLEDGQREGWNAMRITWDASFLRDRPVNVPLWEAHEEEVTCRTAGAPLVAVCQYARRRLPASFISAALRTHPLVILGGSIYEGFSPTVDLPGALSRHELS